MKPGWKSCRRTIPPCGMVTVVRSRINTSRHRIGLLDFGSFQQVQYQMRTKNEAQIELAVHT